MSRTKYDVVYWWQGGTERGEWREAAIGGAGTLEAATRAQVISIERMGYVAHPGLRSVGPPDGPPDRDDFKRVGFID